MELATEYALRDQVLKEYKFSYIITQKCKKTEMLFTNVMEIVLIYILFFIDAFQIYSDAEEKVEIKKKTNNNSDIERVHDLFG